MNTNTQRDRRNAPNANLGLTEGSNCATRMASEMTITLDPTKVKKQRRIPRLRKVYYGYYDREFQAPHPLIRLRGKYLEDFGFAIGDKIEVDFQPHCIIITKVLP
ncbi:MAG: type I addiction module toxin, SymE family [Ignavibacteria bacterium]|nr:type I addiction module toxin, SymE family [Ignavibacteria bacterium]